MKKWQSDAIRRALRLERDAGYLRFRMVCEMLLSEHDIAEELEVEKLLARIDETIRRSMRERFSEVKRILLAQSQAEIRG